MSALISGWDALVALKNGDVVEMSDSDLDMPWTEICVKEDDFIGKVEPCVWMFLNTPEHIKFRRKRKMITINGVEVPTPFKPEVGDYYFYLSSSTDCGYMMGKKDSPLGHGYGHDRLGAWKTEDEIKQIVEALGGVLNG